MSKSFRDIKKVSRRLGIKGKSAGPWGEGKPEAKDGVCPACKQYDVELDKNGYCRDNDCKHDRLVKALIAGEAMKLPPTPEEPDGRIIWTPGTKLRDV